MKKRTWIMFTLLLTGAVFFFVNCLPCAEGIRPAGGMLRGKVYGYNMYDEPIPLIWARVSAYENDSLVGSIPTGANGTYTMFLPSGRLNVTVQYAGFKTQARIVSISEGGATQLDFYLERSEVPIPEFEAYFVPFVAASLLAITTVLTKRKRR